jgi:dipeptidyl aminopeptidase/acylaminoacyl peptidase
MALDDVERRMDAVADARAAAGWLADTGWADRGRIAAMGQSYGGFMVLACLCTHPEAWAAGVDLYGIASFVSFLERTHPMRRSHREAEYGSLERDRALLERISPLNHVARIRAPLLAVHGERDIRVPIGETEQIVRALEARGVPVELIRLPDEGHGLVRLANRLRVYPAIADFLDRHLAPRA